MRIEQVRVGTPVRITLFHKAQHVTDNLIGMVAIEQARPKVDLPANGPSGSHVAPIEKRALSCLKELRMCIRGNLVARIETVEVGDVTMLILRIVYIGKPLLQLVILANLHGWQAVDHVLQGIAIGGTLGVKHLRGSEDGGQGIQHDLRVHRATGSQHGSGSLRTMFG